MNPRERQICLRLNDKEYLLLEQLSERLYVKRNDILRIMIVEKAKELGIWSSP